MKKIILSCLSFVFIFIFFTESVLANDHHSIRLALFDNPQPDPSRKEDTQQFVNSYLAGVNTAITFAASKGLYITEKDFFHSNNLADIVQKAADTKAWNPDIIIGLSTSNDFLMSKAFFGDEVILSISATDPALTSLPKGFYSLGIPDTNAVNAITNFIHQHYPNANLFITAAAESKESVDFADLFAKIYKTQYLNKKITERKFLTDDMNHLDFSKFTSGYQKDDVIVVMSIGYDSAIALMNKMSAYLNPIKPIFITSADNWGNSTTPQNMQGSYDAFRIDTLSGGEDTKDYKVFLENFIKIYHQPPKDKISFVTYQTIMSFVDALLKYSPGKNSSAQKVILLNSYLHALKDNPNWYRPPHYMVYKLENQKEVFFEKIV